ncbi:MAG: methyltransferase domain-containing protein [Nitriliruptorales bacterium]|nr:methyltransferase domain-containing protein [Nitriliruptorales bacterium]
MAGHRDRTRTPSESRPGPPGFFAATLPGLGSLLRAEIADHPHLTADEEPGFDGRADIVSFRARRGARWELSDLRLAEDVFTVVGDADGNAAPRRVAAALLTQNGLERALSVWTRFVRHLSPAMTYRVITRVLDERRFKRTELRRAVTETIAASRPRWRTEDPSGLEIWVLEHRKSQFVAGLRLSDQRMRQHGEGRAAERHGALRPVVAAAMVRLAGQMPGRLLDPCCGSGAIVREALDSDWDARGSDIDAEAVEVASANLPAARVEQADALKLPHADATFDAVVTNLPFGNQFKIDGDPKAWLIGALREFARVTRPGGRVVVLQPPPTPKNPPGLTLLGSHPLRLLGTSTRIWVYDRSDSPVGSGRDDVDPLVSVAR